MSQPEFRWRGAKALENHLYPVDALTAFPGNVIDEKHVLSIANSLDQFGQVRAILLWENAADFDLPSSTIVGGHHVWLGAQSDRLRWSHVAAIPAHFESYEKAEKYLALDNLLGKMSAERVDAQLSILDQQGATEELDPEAFAAWEAERTHAIAMAQVSELKQHERSTRQDPADVIDHLSKQLEEFGFTETVVVARDGTILKGEDVFRAAAQLGIDKVPVKRMDIDPDSPEALRIMAMDYAGGKRAMVDDRAFAEMLKELHETTETLDGTGYDPEMLATMIMVARTAAEIKDANAAMEWVGLPEYEKIPLPAKLTISFADEEARELFVLERLPEAIVRKRHLRNLSMWWPPRERDDPHSLRFVGARPSDDDVGTSGETPESQTTEAISAPTHGNQR